ncbi:hypothetical protein CBR_g29638 [Chara braunii]|uniref:Uncharacterized protein n=1 Tax=Chara braunii TaxID=69332 RepID=A0A388LBD1_CHABU|nr:hypothetical protein CBR_g29638 [Chara braunii]|eukprot:GBG79492.1 hypothetical protein CBR_g29638 [Chara braunii]
MDLGLSLRLTSVQQGRGSLLPHRRFPVSKQRRVNLNLTLCTGGSRALHTGEPSGSQLSGGWTGGQSSVSSCNWFRQNLEETATSSSSWSPFISLGHGFDQNQPSDLRQLEIQEKAAVSGSLFSPPPASVDCGVVKICENGPRELGFNRFHDRDHWRRNLREEVVERGGGGGGAGRGERYLESQSLLSRMGGGSAPTGSDWAGCRLTSARPRPAEDSTSPLPFSSDDAACLTRGVGTIAEDFPMKKERESAGCADAGRQETPPPAGVLGASLLSYRNGAKGPYGCDLFSATGVVAKEMASPDAIGSRCLSATAAVRPDAELAAMTILPRAMLPPPPSAPGATARSPVPLRSPTCGNFSNHTVDRNASPSPIGNFCAPVHRRQWWRSPPPKDMATQEESPRTMERGGMAADHDKRRVDEEARKEEQQQQYSGQKRKMQATEAAEAEVDPLAGPMLGLAIGWTGEKQMPPTDLSSERDHFSSVLVQHGDGSGKQLEDGSIRGLPVVGGGGGGGGGWSRTIEEDSAGRRRSVIDNSSGETWRGLDGETAAASAAAFRRETPGPIWSQARQDSERRQQHDLQTRGQDEEQLQQRISSTFAPPSTGESGGLVPPSRGQNDGFAPRNTSQTDLIAATSALTEMEIRRGAWTQKQRGDDLFEAAGGVTVPGSAVKFNTKCHLEYSRKENAVETAAAVIRETSASFVEWAQCGDQRHARYNLGDSNGGKNTRAMEPQTAQSSRVAGTINRELQNTLASQGEQHKPSSGQGQDAEDVASTVDDVNQGMTLSGPASSEQQGSSNNTAGDMSRVGPDQGFCHEQHYTSNGNSGNPHSRMRAAAGGLPPSQCPLESDKTRSDGPSTLSDRISLPKDIHSSNVATDEEQARAICRQRRKERFHQLKKQRTASKESCFAPPSMVNSCMSPPPRLQPQPQKQQRRASKFVNCADCTRTRCQVARPVEDCIAAGYQFAPPVYNGIPSVGHAHSPPEGIAFPGHHGGPGGGIPLYPSPVPGGNPMTPYLQYRQFGLSGMFQRPSWGPIASPYFTFAAGA